MNQQRISILGCGWLGFPLARKLIEKGHFVRGSTTTKEKIPLLEESGIEPFYLRIDPHLNGDEAGIFFDVDTVVLNFPPPRVDDRISFMLQQGEELVHYLNSSSAGKVIMASSTGVYGFKNQLADESDPWPPETENGKGLAAMEKLLTDKLKAPLAIVRLAGLIGPGRHPGRFLSERNKHGNSTGKYSISGNGNEPVNLIHLNDAIGVIEMLIEKPEITGVFNACMKKHPSRNEFYRRAAERLGFEPPRFSGGEERPWKRISSKKIRKATGYRFHYDDPADALDDM